MMTETVDDACERLTPFMTEVVIKLFENGDISAVLSVEELGDIVGSAFRVAWRQMTS